MGGGRGGIAGEVLYGIGGRRFFIFFKMGRPMASPHFRMNLIDKRSDELSFPPNKFVWDIVSHIFKDGF